VLHRFPGGPNDNLGFAVADAGDPDGDRVHDIITGGPGNDSATTPGVAHLYSGRTGRLLELFRGRDLNDQFGAAVAGAGDQDGDRRADVLIGAPGVDARGADSGRAYVHSGKRHRLLRRLDAGDAGDAGDAFGAGTDWTPDATGDRVPDLIVGAAAAGPQQNGAVYLFSGRTGRERWRALAPPTGVNLGRFFVAGVGDVNRDRVPDVYGADYADASLGPDTGRAALFSGVDGRELQSFTGAPGAGLGPGREAGDVDRDGRPDLAIGSYLSSAGAPRGGRVEVYAPDGALLRTITSTTPGESLGFDAVGIGDVDGDRLGDLLLSAADGQTVYVVAGERVP
jgi:hypothetical protein